MLEIPEDTLETVLAGLMRMGIGRKAHATIEAALHLLREQQREREREREEEVAWERPVVREWEEGLEETGQASPGAPLTSPRDDLRRPPAAPIPLGWPRVVTRDQATQTGSGTEAPPSTWLEVEGALERAREAEREGRRLRDAAFAALDKWAADHPEPSAQAAKWQRLVEEKKEELRHTATWLAERRVARQLKEAEAEADQRRREELAAAQAKRQAEERAFAEARARLEEARRREEQLAGTTQDQADHTPAPPPRYCPVCGRATPRGARRCPDRANHPPRKKGL